MRRDVHVAAVLAVPLIAALAFSYARLISTMDHVPAAQDYVDAKQLLMQQQFDPNTDALAILPAWSLRPLTVVGDWSPISADNLAAQPLHRYRRLFVWAEPDSDDALTALLTTRGAPADRQRCGRVEVLRFDLNNAPVVFDLRAQLSQAQVRITGARGDDHAVDVECDTPVAGGFACPTRPNWQRVTRQWALVSDNGDDVVWSHPPPAGQRLSIAWRAVPLGARMIVRAGHLRSGAEHARAAVRLRIEVDDVIIDSITVEPRFAFASYQVDLTRVAPGSHKLALVIDTDDEASNHFAWDAYVVAS